jgi:hypothetical protein
MSTDHEYTFQVVVDCADPHRLARFWSAAIDYAIEDNNDQILGLIEQGLVTREETMEIDGRLFFKVAVALNDPAGKRPRLLFQVVPERKTVKNRVHLDLRVPADSHADEVKRLKGLGATWLWNGRQGPHTWATMADPEGNEFCVS